MFVPASNEYAGMCFAFSQVNDVDYMDGISHEKAVETLKKTSGAVRFVLRRPVPTRNMGPQVLITSASVEKVS